MNILLHTDDKHNCHSREGGNLIQYSYAKFLFTMLCLFNITGYSQEIKDRVEEILKSSFRENISFEMKKFEIPAAVKKKIENEVQQRFFAEHVFIYKIHSSGNLKGYAIIDNVYGKSMPITFLVLFDTTGSIISSDIVKYREQYGGGVSAEKWNNQFKGKDSNSGFTVGRDIDAISGATISVHSVTKGIQKLSLLFHEVKNSL